MGGTTEQTEIKKWDKTSKADITPWSEARRLFAATGRPWSYMQGLKGQQGRSLFVWTPEKQKRWKELIKKYKERK